MNNGALAGLAAIMMIVVVAQVIVAIGFYIWIALALSAVFRKAGERPWKAWVPFLNVWTLFTLGGVAGWWVLVLIAGGLLAVILGGIVIVLPPAIAIAVRVLQAVVLLASIVIFIIFHIRALLGVNRSFGLGGGSFVLGLLVFPVWASVVGWGSARWLGGGNASSAAPGYSRQPGFAGPPPAAPQAGPRVPPPPPMPASMAANRAPVPQQAAAPAFGAPPAPPIVSSPAPAPNAAFAQTPASSSAANPWAPPAPPASAAQPTPARASAPPAPAPVPVSTPAAAPAWTPRPVDGDTVSPGVAAQAAAASSPAPVAPAAPSGPEGDDLEDRTVIVDRRPATPVVVWRLGMPDGASVALSGPDAVLGRNPAAPPTALAAQLIPVADTTRTVSKTHALLHRTDAGWTISDLGSTNGVIVIDAAGVETTVSDDTLVETRFLLGDAEFTLTQEG